MPLRRYDISNTVLDQAKAMNLDEPILETVKNMLVSSARVTHVDGNRRYKDYLFNIVNNVVCSLVMFVPDKVAVAVKDYSCKFCEDTRLVFVYETCQFCDGEGDKSGVKCDRCVDGEVMKSIPCQDCGGKVKPYKK